MLRSSESRSFGADDYQSIGEFLAKTLIERTAVKLVRPGTWSMKRSIISFNAHANLAGMQCATALKA
jgi:hypothetical protein